jgi:molybdopterin molybdotransferase
VISLDEARAVLLEGHRPLPARRVPLELAVGCVAARDVVTTEDLPPFDVAAMDGYALRAPDIEQAAAGHPVRLAVVGTVLAGDAAPRPLGAGEAARIMTGAPVPPGADAILVLERARTESAGGVLVLDEAVHAGAHVRPRGDDLAAGDRLVAAGSPIRPAEVAVLASAGVSEVSVVPRPTVGLLSTGDELSEGPLPLARGRVRDANRPLLGSVLRAAGFEVVDLGIVGDDVEALGKALGDGAIRCDTVVTTGGVCDGDRDLTAGVLAEASRGRARSLRVALRPGKPLAFGEIAGVPVVGLPGNPVAALVALLLVAMPLLRRLGGEPGEAPLRARSEVALRRRRDGKVHALLATAGRDETGALTVAPSPRQGAHLVSALATANVLMVLPDGLAVEEGGEVEIVPLPGWGRP